LGIIICAIFNDLGQYSGHRMALNIYIRFTSPFDSSFSILGVTRPFIFCAPRQEEEKVVKTIHIKHQCIIIASNYIAKRWQRSCYSAREIHSIILNVTTVIIPNNKWNEENFSKR